MKHWIIEKWDWWVYRRSYNTFRRMCERNQGFAYLFELTLRDYRKLHPIPETLERATELFYDSLPKR